jgi:adenine/guanine phosphoribosyltransferase-like PRPP-binding protein
MKHIYKTAAGDIFLDSDDSRKTLDNILSFACRENPKRHFILINKLIGRYTPTAPKVMRQTYEQLVDRVGVGGRSYVVSLAEAATGLGAGVADSLSRRQENVYFQHTTRQQVNDQLWFSIDEEHSHAVNHLFYKPNSELLGSIIKSTRLIIVDDEITTGRTIKQLLDKLVKLLPNLEEIIVTSLVNLGGKKNILKESELGLPVRFVSLINADLNIKINPDFKPRLPQKVNKSLCVTKSSSDFGRCGLRMPYLGKLNSIKSSNSAIVIADGEHQYIPFLLAEKLEKSGIDVLFQSINRSPILPCEIIQNKYKIKIESNDLEHYLYNYFPENRSVFVVSENNYEGLKFADGVNCHEWRH